MKRKLILAFLFICLLIFVITNKTAIIQEHLVSSPSLKEVQDEIDETNRKLDELTTKFNKMNEAASAQAQDAAAAKAQLTAMKKS